MTDATGTESAGTESAGTESAGNSVVEAGPPLRTLVLNAAVCFVLAHLVVVLLHELAHVVAGLALGYHNVLVPFGVTHAPEPGRGDSTIMALAGPVFSLVTGLVAMAVQPFRSGRGFAHLLWLWLAYVSVMEGVGYLLLTPFGVGDTGATAALYENPAWVGWPCFAIAVVGTVWLAMRFGTAAARHTTADLTSLRGFGFFPWIIGTVVAVGLTGLNLVLSTVSFTPGEVIAVLMGSFALGVFAPMAIPFGARQAARRPEIGGSELLHLPKVPVAGVAVIAVIVLLNVLVLSRGVPIG